MALAISDKACFIGVMSGTSLDGIDAALVCFDTDGKTGGENAEAPLVPQLLVKHSLAIPADLREKLTLQGLIIDLVGGCLRKPGSEHKCVRTHIRRNLCTAEFLECHD